ncbi:ste12 interacting [Fusarium albosuccineum]|uniref:Ste12 interacting n=1 Tax=Fusarium albosuccineum TaxID=1237068 RepID=A0A8H4P2F9_9HYPO|nr:ste12 interacting [Fusarium albosuccineum]
MGTLGRASWAYVLKVRLCILPASLFFPFPFPALDQIQLALFLSYLLNLGPYLVDSVVLNIDSAVGTLTSLSPRQLIHLPPHKQTTLQPPLKMTYTMTAHLCKQIYASWRQTRQPSPEPSISSSPLSTSPSLMRPFSRSPSPPAQRSERRPSNASESDWNPNSRH